jgi:hypothetical protein
MYHNNGTAINKQVEVEAEARTSPAIPYKGPIPSD